MKKNTKKINISFIMYGGLSYGGAHRQAITLASALDKNKFNVRYFWNQHNKDEYSNFSFPQINLHFLDELKNHGVKTVKFYVGSRDISHPYHPWKDTNFFNVFSNFSTDLIFAVRAGHPEFPFVHLNFPLIEWNVFAGVDYSENLVYSVAVSSWVHKKYLEYGGDRKKSDYCYHGIDLPLSKGSFKKKYGIKDEEIVIGFHQRDDDNIFAKHALIAWKYVKEKSDKKVHFFILGGSSKYKKFADKLGLKVNFLPIEFKKQNISKFLNTLDIFTHSAGVGETLGIAVQEAMIHNLPIVSMFGLNNGHVDIIGNTINIARNQEEYNKTLLELIINNGLRREISKKSFLRAKNNFSVINTVSYFENLFIEKYKEYCIGKKQKFNTIDMSIYNKFSWRVTIYRLIYSFPVLIKLATILWLKVKKIRVILKKIKNYVTIKNSNN